MNKDVITRERAIEILSPIARDAGNAAMDRIRAVETLARMNGWNQPLRVELSAADFQAVRIAAGRRRERRHGGSVKLSRRPARQDGDAVPL